MSIHIEVFYFKMRAAVHSWTAWNRSSGTQGVRSCPRQRIRDSIENSRMKEQGKPGELRGAELSRRSQLADLAIYRSSVLVKRLTGFG